jgi:hypothetical protein
MTYEAKGDVRGSCGHKHRTIATAQACCDRDARRMMQLPGRCYSDRYVCRTDGQRLTEWERDELYHCQDEVQ